MKIIIFGGNGFVGRWLIKELKNNDYEILSCDLTDMPIEIENNTGSKGASLFRYQRVDIRNIEEIRSVPINTEDIIINLAANQYHGKVPRKNRKKWFFETNTDGAENIMKVMREKDCSKLIQFTTDMTYGKPQYLPVDTKHPQNPFGPYGQSKKAVEDICYKYRASGMNITIFRPRMINGPGRLGILKKLFVLIKHNLPVPTIGSGKNCYQMVSVFDCVSAIMAAIKHGIPNEDFNLGSKNPPSTRDLLKGLIHSVGSKSIVIPTPGKLVKFTLAAMGALGFEIMYKEQYMIADENYVLDISKTEEKLGWEPKYADGDMLIEAYKAFSGQGTK